MKRKFKDEGDVKDAVKQILKRIPLLKYDMPGATMYGKSGRHDFIICQQGFFWTIETKFATKPPTDGQIDFANDIADAGGMSLCINERNLARVAAVAVYIHKNNTLPLHLRHDFEKWRKQ